MLGMKQTKLTAPMVNVFTRSRIIKGSTCGNVEEGARQVDAAIAAARADSGDRLSGNRFLRHGSGCVGLGWIEVGWVRLLWVGLGWGD